MANWDDIIHNRVMMGRARPLCLAMNALRRRREGGEEERRPRVIPFLGRGIAPVEQRENQQERVPGRNGNINMARGRSRSYPAPPPNIFRSQPHSQPCCLTVGFGYVAHNAQFPPRLNSPFPHVPNSPHQLPPLHPFPKSKIMPKVPPQSLLTLRTVTLLKPIVAVLETLSQFLFF